MTPKPSYITDWQPIEAADITFTDVDGDTLQHVKKDEQRFLHITDTEKGTTNSFTLPGHMRLCESHRTLLGKSAQDFYSELIERTVNTYSAADFVQEAHLLAEEWQLEDIPE